MIKKLKEEFGYKKKEWFILAVMGAVGFINITKIFLYLFHGKCNFVDFHARWQESAYLLHGIVPNEVNEQNMIPEIGQHAAVMVSAPWSWFMGIVANFGFAPYEVARVLQMAVFGIVFLMAGICIYRKVMADKEHADVLPAIMAVMVLACQQQWIESVKSGNHGAIVACLIIIAICIMKEHPIVSGILMTFAMMKPQLAAIFIVIFLLQKEYKVIVTMLIGGGTSVLGAAILCHRNPITLIIGELERGGQLRGYYWGIFELLKEFDVSMKSVVALSMAGGILFTILYWQCVKKYTDNLFILYSGAAIASTFWSYKNPEDNVILAIPCIAFLIMFLSERTKKGKFVSCAGLVLLLAIEPIRKKGASCIIQI